VNSFRLEPGPVHLVRLDTGGDVLESITDYVTEHNIRAAAVSFLGAVRRASLRYYNQDAQQYIDFDVNEHLEVLAGTGNVSVLDGAPFVHIHAAFGAAEGRAYGGHVNAGTEVFACEVTISELDGIAPVRQPDETTGLMLWGPPDS